MLRRRGALYSLGMMAACGVWGCQSAPFVADEAPNETEATSDGDKPMQAGIGRNVAGWPDDSPMALLPYYSTSPETENDDMRWLLDPGSEKNVWNGPNAANPGWIRQPGSSMLDSVYGIAAGSDGFIYVVGQTLGTDSDMVDSGGDMTGTPYGVSSQSDVFVKKYKPSGALVWTRRLASDANKSDYATSVAYSAIGGGAIYVAGYTEGLVPAGLNGRTGEKNAQRDVFLAKFNTEGAMLWTSIFGSALDDIAWGVAAEQISGHQKSNGDVYVVGSAKEALPTAVKIKNDDAFVARFDANGNRLWIKQFGTSGADIARGVAVDSDSNVYVAGDTTGTLNGRTGGVVGGNTDIFLAKYSENGAVVNLEQYGTTTVDYASGVAVSRKNGTSTEVYVAGYTRGSWFGPNVDSTMYDGVVFHYKNNQTMGNTSTPTATDLGSVTWGNQSSQPGQDMAAGITADGLGNAYVAATFGTGMTAYGSTAKFSSTGSNTDRFKIDSPMMENGRAVAADYDNGVYLVGDTLGSFNLGTADTTTTNKGQNDGIIARWPLGCALGTRNDGNCGVGWGWGDPHLRTFDGTLYDFHGFGEFVVVESTGGLPLMIQGRQKPYMFNSRAATYSAIATMLGSERVALYAIGSAQLRINGQATTLSPGMLRPTAGGGSILRRSQEEYVLDWPSGERALIRVYQGRWMDITTLALPLSRQNQIRGLLGNYDNIKTNDFALRNGMNLGPSLTFAQMYTNPNNYADSWRIMANESLFDYDVGEAHGAWDAVPPGTINLSDFSDADRIAAEQICTAAGVTDPTLLHQCIIDVVVTGDAVAAEGAAAMQNVINDQALPPEAMSAATVYSNDMQTAIGAEWSSAFMCVSPAGDRQMLGEFGNEMITLSLPAVPPHAMVTVEFDLILINGWDGEGPMGPSTFGFFDDAEGSLLLTTFSNTGSPQSYPGPYPSNNTPMFGSSESYTLGYPFGDSVYHLGFTYPHTDSNVMLHFYAQGLSGLMGEAWAVDNVNVVVSPN